MRVLDQELSCDIPYDGACIMRDDGNIIAYLPAAAGNNLKILLAEYRDPENAKKAMKKLRIAYQRNIDSPFDRVVGKMTEYFQFPPEEHL